MIQAKEVTFLSIGYHIQPMLANDPHLVSRVGYRGFLTRVFCGLGERQLKQLFAMSVMVFGHRVTRRSALSCLSVAFARSGDARKPLRRRLYLHTSSAKFFPLRCWVEVS
ncbi:hypothetical protein CFELI_09585 [Corynebacterium felinum]|uniref:Transposase n=1 Tax=Corynebacterium felinum TaxID=131318 RepID=A0ABU2BD48_9CORY|nr:hypothetical protein [Corynebacterium felinum]WJY95520.1 hypothetical protein CFELI_09585 [Corynebacterium felinum]